MNLQLGLPAPAFTLFDSEKKKVSLSDYKGKQVLILFFPLAFTSVCTKELCHVRDNISIYNNLEIQTIAISVDSLYALAQYKKAENLNFTLLSDFNKEVSSLYGSLYENFSYGMRGVSKRSAFLIDTEGVIKYIEVLEDAGLVPDFQQIKALIQKI
jgi:peroxiredoxin